MGCSPWGHKESDMTERLSIAHLSEYIVIFFLHSLSPLLSASRLNTLNFSMTISTRLNCFILCLVLLHIRH